MLYILIMYVFYFTRIVVRVEVNFYFQVGFYGQEFIVVDAQPKKKNISTSV